MFYSGWTIYHQISFISTPKDHTYDKTLEDVYLLNNYFVSDFEVIHNIINS